MYFFISIMILQIIPQCTLQTANICHCCTTRFDFRQEIIEIPLFRHSLSFLMDVDELLSFAHTHYNQLLVRFLFPAIFPKLSKENIQVILTCRSNLLSYPLDHIQKFLLPHSISYQAFSTRFQIGCLQCYL